MAHRKTLTQAQLDLLRWIAEGCPDGVLEGDGHHVSAAALRRRDLVKTFGRGKTWRAEITPAGSKYLEWAKTPGAEPPRQANVSVTEGLVRRVEDAGGVLRVKQERGAGSVDYTQRVQAAIRHGRVPAGKKLSSRWTEGEIEIRLEDVAPGFESDEIAVRVPERVARYHPAVKRFRDTAERHEVSRAQMSRALRILHALAVAAEGRGWQVANVEPSSEPNRYSRSRWTGANDGHLFILAGEFSQALQIREEGLPSRAQWEKELRQSRPYWAGEPRHKPLGKYEEKASGRLAITLVPSYGGRKWADRKSWTLEEKLPEVLQEIEIGAAAAEHARREAKRREEEHQREWEAAMERAKERYLQAYRADVLLRRVESWQQVEGIRAYCDAVEAKYPPGSSEAELTSSEWINWARAYADRVDPLRQPPGMPDDPQNVGLEDLKPFLDGWSPYGPKGWG